MSKGKGYKKKSIAKATAPPHPAAAKDHSILLYVLLVVAVLICYFPVLNAGFVNWDDDDYVVKNTTIRSLSNLPGILTEPVQGNYHPLTMFSFAVNYAVSGLDPLSYHVVNLIFHLLNTILVFRLIQKIKPGIFIAFTTALLFGIHPLHVESVAWISERKDVLYTFFFLLGLIHYASYLKSGRVKYFGLTFLWFLLSILSKPAAIIFPVALFCLDFIMKRKFQMKLLYGKIPFLIVAAFFAYLTLAGQETAGATDKTDAFSFGERILFAFYGYFMYFFKMILPVNLVAFYPTPPVNLPLPDYFYFTPLFFIATVVLCLVTWKKYPEITFGISFYLVNLLLVLQLKLVGSALIADRYTYIPLIGWFFILGWLLDKFSGKRKTSAYAILAVIAVILIPVSYLQAETWKNGEALWENAIRKHPGSKAYVIRASELNEKGNYDRALKYYSEALKINASEHEAFGNRGNIYFNRQQDSLALMDYNKALQLKSDYVPALANRGSLYARAGRYTEGLNDLNRALELNPKHAPAVKNRGTTYMAIGQFDKAITDFRAYLEYEPEEIEILNAIGVCYQKMGQYENSVEAFTEAVAKKPLPLYFLNRSISYRALGNVDQARTDALEARRLGQRIDPEYARILGI